MSLQQMGLRHKSSKESPSSPKLLTSVMLMLFIFPYPSSEHLSLPFSLSLYHLLQENSVSRAHC